MIQRNVVVLTDELKLKLERLAVLKAQLASLIEYDRWQEVYGGERENSELPVELADELIKALVRAFALHAEAEEQAHSSLDPVGHQTGVRTEVTKERRNK